MANCVQCHHPIDDSYSFCPDCGVDNRPPEQRRDVAFCTHQFVPGHRYCIACGADYNDPRGSTPDARRRDAGGWFLGSVAFVFASLLVVGFHFITHGTWRSFINGGMVFLCLLFLVPAAYCGLQGILIRAKQQAIDTGEAVGCLLFGPYYGRGWWWW